MMPAIKLANIQTVNTKVRTTVLQYSVGISLNTTELCKLPGKIFGNVNKPLEWSFPFSNHHEYYHSSLPVKLLLVIVKMKLSVYMCMHELEGNTQNSIYCSRVTLR